MADPASTPIVRIAVALGMRRADPEFVAAVEKIAAEAKAQIEGLFLEDADLLKLAELPIASDICLVTHVQQSMSAQRVEREWRARAMEARHTVASIASHAGAEFSFRRVRGSIPGELSHAAPAYDILAVAGARTAMDRKADAKRFATVPAFPTGRARRMANQPVIVIIDGGVEDDRAVKIASSLSTHLSAPLFVVLNVKTAQDAQALKSAIMERWPSSNALFVAAIGLELSRLIARVDELKPGIAVLSFPDDKNMAQVMKTLSDELDCPAIMVRKNQP
jgi:hypothetical protein